MQCTQDCHGNHRSESSPLCVCLFPLCMCVCLKMTSVFISICMRVRLVVCADCAISLRTEDTFFKRWAAQRKQRGFQMVWQSCCLTWKAWMFIFSLTCDKLATLTEMNLEDHEEENRARGMNGKSGGEVDADRQREGKRGRAHTPTLRMTLKKNKPHQESHNVSLTACFWTCRRILKMCLTQQSSCAH